jgi:hypothetical protein
MGIDYGKEGIGIGRFVDRFGQLEALASGIVPWLIPYFLVVVAGARRAVNR